MIPQIYSIASFQIPIRIIIYYPINILINSLIIIPDTFLYVNFTCLANSSAKNKVKKTLRRAVFVIFPNNLLQHCSMDKEITDS